MQFLFVINLYSNLAKGLLSKNDFLKQSLSEIHFKQPIQSYAHHIAPLCITYSVYSLYFFFYSFAFSWKYDKTVYSISAAVPIHSFWQDVHFVHYTRITFVSKPSVSEMLVFINICFRQHKCKWKIKESILHCNLQGT